MAFIAPPMSLVAAGFRSVGVFSGAFCLSLRFWVFFASNFFIGFAPLNYFARQLYCELRGVAALAGRRKARPQSLQRRDAKSLSRSPQLIQGEFAIRNSRERSV